ncbi:MAG: hypothetical protein ACJAZB_001719 [Psychrosphaera sp.]|jgi:hypothetical protein
MLLDVWSGWGGSITNAHKFNNPEYQFILDILALNYSKKAGYICGNLLFD